MCLSWSQKSRTLLPVDAAATETGEAYTWSLYSVTYTGLVLMPFLAGEKITIRVNQSRVALAFYIALDLSVAYAVDAVDCAFSEKIGSNAGLVAVEGGDMKHVAVCTHSDGLHLAIPRQWSRMGGAARAEDLKGHRT